MIAFRRVADAKSIRHPSGFICHLFGVAGGRWAQKVAEGWQIKTPSATRLNRIKSTFYLFRWQIDR